MFIKTNDRLVNLKNVSNINILKRDRRIIFNLNYSVEIHDQRKDQYKYISDYVYWDFVGDNDFDQAIVTLTNNQYIHDNFIKHDHGFINTDEISSIKFSEKKNRVIFNLSHPVTFTDYDGYDNITSEFVYMNCHTPENYRKYSVNVKNILLGE